MGDDAYDRFAKARERVRKTLPKGPPTPELTLECGCRLYGTPGLGVDVVPCVAHLEELDQQTQKQHPTSEEGD